MDRDRVLLSLCAAIAFAVVLVVAFLGILVLSY